MLFSNRTDHLNPNEMDWSLVGPSTLEEGVAKGYPGALEEMARRES